MAFAAHQFKLSARQKDGATLREHLEAAAAHGVVHPLLGDEPPFPEGCETLWDDFRALHGSRGHGMAGPLPITFHDFDAYERVNRVKLDAWEIDAIRLADRAYFDSLPVAKTS